MSTQPYISFVVAARHDDHGGNFMRRMQAFTHGLLEQCRRHKLRAELVVVEWNPLPDRCGLAEALEWPSDADEDEEWCPVRFIQVPPAVHERFAHSGATPLYQMIAKNVGLRRARGEWILATNIDIFFNNALMSFLASRQLDPTRMYRIDRHDAADGFPLWAGIDSQLAYCESSLLRVFAREATFDLNEQGHRVWPGRDIVDARKLGLGSGWFPPELSRDTPFRYVEDGALISIPSHSDAETITIWMEPGYNAEGPVAARLEAEDGTIFASANIVHAEPLCAVLAPASERTGLRLRFEAEWAASSFELRLALAVVWSVALGASQDPPAGVRVAPPRPPIRSLNLADRAAIWMRQNTSGLHAALAPPYRRFTGRNAQPLAPPAPAKKGTKLRPPVFLHNNACGDFTLLHRDAWEDVRGYPEFDAFAMNIDSALCWAAHYAGYSEHVLGGPMRIYHMEHGLSATPENAQLLYDRVTRSGLPWLEYSELLGWVESMHSWQRPMIFNGSDWGHGGLELRETQPAIGGRYAELRWCRDDPESPSRRQAPKS